MAVHAWRYAKMVSGEAAAIDIAALEFAWPRGKHVLSIERLALGAGERVFLQGPSGSGKSTLLGLIGGVLIPQSGVVSVMGTPLNRLEPGARDRFRSEHIGFIFQMFNLIPYLTVRENVLLPLQFSPARLRRIQAVSPDREAQRLLEALGLIGNEMLDRPVTQLSIGQQQRVAAARALIGRPDIVIADEPTSALDSDTRAGFLELLMAECSALGATLLFVSHDAALSARFDRSLSMSDINRLTTPEGDMDSLRSTPDSFETRGE
jgi:putative ABC transport system ATP-binding protein